MSKCFPRRQLSDALGLRMGWIFPPWTWDEVNKIQNQIMSFVKNNTFKLTFPTHLKKAMGNIKCHTLVYVSSTSIKVVLQNPIICLTADVYFMTPVTNEI